MQWLTGLVALLGTQGAYANASRSLAEERDAVAQIDRFLLRSDHPAGRSRIPTEPPAGGEARIA